MRAAYFDVFAGASGDMILGSLVDAGASLVAIQGSLRSLAIGGWEIRAEEEQRGAIGGTRIRVQVDPTVHQPERGRADIVQLVDASDLSPRVKDWNRRVFGALALAEGRVHRLPPDEVHFHEVGAVDSIVDVVGSLVALDSLGIETLYISSVPLGGGMAKSRHGQIPVPAPATLQLLAEASAPVRPSSGSAAHYEMVTPTAAAIFTAIGRFEQPAILLERVGYGIGGRQLPDLPNALRVWIGELRQDEPTGLRLIETNIDDERPEILGHVLDRLLSEGARDVWFTAIQMKKNRPATMVSVIADAGLESRMADVLLRETSTFGVRVQPVQRHEAERAHLEVVTAIGTARVKCKRIAGALVGLAPEYEDCRRLAMATLLPLAEVYRIVETAARQQMEA